MNSIKAAMALFGLLLFGSVSTASAQVVIHRSAVTRPSAVIEPTAIVEPTALTVDRLLGPDVLVAPTTERVMTFPAVIPTEQVLRRAVLVPPAPVLEPPMYVPGVHLPGRYTTVRDLSDVILPTVNW